MALATAMITLSKVFQTVLFIGIDVLEVKLLRSVRAHIERPTFFYLAHGGLHPAFHPAHGRHQRCHVRRVVRIEAFVRREAGQRTYLTGVVFRVVTVFGRCPSGNDVAYRAQAVFVAIGAQHDEGRTVSPRHAPEREELRVGLPFGQALPQVCRASDIERVAVAQPSLLVQLFHSFTDLDAAFFLVAVLFGREVHPFERESLVVERHGFFELGVRREADAELGNIGRVVLFSCVATQTVGHGTEAADVAQMDTLAFLQGIDDLFLQGRQYGQAIVPRDGTGAADACGNLLDSDFGEVDDETVILARCFRVARVFAFDDFVIHNVFVFKSLFFDFVTLLSSG